MGIFDLFKKLIGEEKVEEIVIEKIGFLEIKGWIENKKRENKLKEKEVLDIISEKIGRHTKDLREKIIILEAFDVKSKKEKDNIKEIVLEWKWFKKVM